MNDWAVASIIALLASLVLAVSAYRAENVERKRMVTHAFVWVMVFGVLILLLS